MGNMVFLSGAMSNIDTREAMEWRENVEDMIYKLDTDWVVFNPTELGFSEYHASLHGEDFERVMMLDDIDKLKNSRVVIANYNYPNSSGTAAELMLAYEKHIPIIAFCSPENRKNIPSWWKYQAMVIVDDYDLAYLFFVDHFVNYD